MTKSIILHKLRSPVFKYGEDIVRNTNKLVYGIGAKGMEYPAWEDNKKLKEYSLWIDMCARCSVDYPKKCPTYLGVTCSDNFKYYPFFYEWCQEQVGFRNKDEKGKSWTMDKDILIKGNKFYSEDTCVFVPQKINKLLNKRKILRGEYPIGVCLDKVGSKFSAFCNDGNGNQKLIGRFPTPKDAFQAYKRAKEVVIRQIAEEYKLQIDPRAYQALLNYTVEITD